MLGRFLPAVAVEVVADSVLPGTDSYNPWLRAPSCGIADTGPCYMPHCGACYTCCT
ncbi:hypothetical protein HanIR_Chr12g0606141 [Helianthus annuus]|nr:hypothetical protein HanIR_Chr12g0606141 [Helianthus annuus]